MLPGVPTNRLSNQEMLRRIGLNHRKKLYNRFFFNYSELQENLIRSHAAGVGPGTDQH
jgi:hypothetical protein